MTRSRSKAAAIVAALSLAVTVPASAQFAVIDVANLTQNILAATRLLQEINNQIQSLQNEAVMIEDMSRNLTSLNTSSLSGITSDLNQIGSLMNQAQGIGFDVQSTESAFNTLYPKSYGSTAIPQLLSDAETRWQDAHDAFQETLTVQSQIAQTVQSDTAKLGTLVTASQGAVGSLQAQQATNQLLALSIKQQLQIQSLMAAEGRAKALSDANNAESEEEGSAAFSDFLGSSSAYSPN